MYDLYERLYTKYVAEYGPKTAIFLMVGSFYELYDIQAPDGRTKMNVKDIVDILGIQLKVKRGDAPGGADGLFSGFPDYVLHKWAAKLTGAGWTVIIVDQVKNGDKVTDRKVSRILSPGTHLEALATYDAPTIVSVWLSGLRYAAAAFDLSTGSTYTTSGLVRGPCGKTDTVHFSTESWTSDELLHFLSVFQPRELLVSGFPGNEEDARKQFDIGRAATAIHLKVASLGTLEIPLAREEMLRRLYKPRTVLPVREYLQLGVCDEEKALCTLMRFVEDHFAGTLERLQANQRWSPDNLLLLGNHALRQLQIESDVAGQAVLDLFKYAATTAFGKRALRARLLSPSAQPAVIKQRLAEVAAAGALDAAVAAQTFRDLRNIYDLPRLHRKMLCADVGAADVLALQSSYAAAATITEAPGFGCLAASDDLKEGLKIAGVALAANFDLERAAQESEDCTWIRPHLEIVEGRITAAVAELTTYLSVLNELAGGANLRFEPREKTPYGIRGTRTALTVLKAALGTPAAGRVLAKLPEEQRTFSVSVQKGGGWVESDWLDRINGRILGLRQQLEREFRLALPDVCGRFCEATQEHWTAIEGWIAAIDVSLALATEARARNWTAPEIIDNTNGSGFEATGLRHPLIESIVSRTKYVAHDVSLGSGNNKGWLVYGMNASGKSSLMKSIGIAVHLAQCGCYVPATGLRIAPYKALFTRILNQDNLWAGLSSFAVEMSEMRDILRAADRHTLVLGDELCSGTESISAKALVAAGIKWLADRGSTYVFATHLHGLTDVLPPPAELGLNIYHLKVHYDPVTHKLIYERTLSPGPGSSLYGLEVARAMNVPSAFLESAVAIRRRLLGSVSDEEAPRSSWNSAVSRRRCELCGCETVKDLEVHHVKPRAEGGSNDAHNLMVLCEGCHDRHHSQPEISPAGQHLTVTSDGPERIVAAAAVGNSEHVAEAQSTASDPKTPKKGKWSDEERSTILKVLADYPNLPAKQVVFRLKHNEGIEISEATLRKFKNGTA
jgi:DNA mismatch repair protein MutS